eukprot:jgi/Psemu1/22155/gm1.22155_g
MASTRAATRSALPRFVLFWSALDAAKQGTKTTTSRMVLGAAFSREHFPKTLAATCLLSFAKPAFALGTTTRGGRNLSLQQEDCKPRPITTSIHNDDDDDTDNRRVGKGVTQLWPHPSREEPLESGARGNDQSIKLTRHMRKNNTTKTVTIVTAPNNPN